MVEDKIKIINDLDIQIKDLKEEIKKVKSTNDKIKLDIQKKLLFLQLLDSKFYNEEV